MSEIIIQTKCIMKECFKELNWCNLKSKNIDSKILWIRSKPLQTVNNYDLNKKNYKYIDANIFIKWSIQ